MADLHFRRHPAPSPATRALTVPRRIVRPSIPRRAGAFTAALALLFSMTTLTPNSHATGTTTPGAWFATNPMSRKQSLFSSKSSASRGRELVRLPPQRQSSTLEGTNLASWLSSNVIRVGGTAERIGVTEPSADLCDLEQKLFVFRYQKP